MMDYDSDLQSILDEDILENCVEDQKLFPPPDLRVKQEEEEPDLESVLTALQKELDEPEPIRAKRKSSGGKSSSSSTKRRKNVRKEKPVDHLEDKKVPPPPADLKVKPKGPEPDPDSALNALQKELEEVEPKPKRKYRKVGRNSPKPRKRVRIAELGEEQFLEHKRLMDARRNEMKRLRRANETDEERKERLQREKERRWKKREQETEQERLERLRREADLARNRRANEPPEKRLRRLQQYLEYNKIRKLIEAGEVPLSEILAKRNEAARLQRTNETEEQREKRLKRWERLKTFSRLKEETDEEYEKRLAILKAEDPEYYEKYMDSKSRQKFRRIEKAINNQLASAEEKKRRRMRHYFWFHSYPPEVQEEMKRKELERNRRWRQSLEGEKKQRYLESVRRAVAKCYYNPEKLKAKYNRRRAKETPEQRQRMLHGYKVQQAKRKLKKRLEGEGCPQEEIERRVKELHEEMWKMPMAPVTSTYKPRPRRNNKCSSNLDSSDSQSQSSTTSTSIAVGEARAFPCTSNYSYPQCQTATFFPPQIFGNEQSGKDKVYPTQDFVELPNDNEDDCGDLRVEVENEEEVDENSTSGHLHEHELVFDDPPSPQARSVSPAASAEVPDTQNHFDTGATLSTLTSPNDEGARNDIVHEEVRIPSTAPVPAPPQQILNCKHCDQVFSDNFGLLQHVKISHPNRCWKCPKCTEVFLSPKELSTHFQGAHNEKKFICVKCGEKFEKQAFLASHVQDLHPEAFWPCSKCKLLKYSEKSLQIHERICKKVTKIQKLILND